ncbi:MAG: GntR family transcriptional regulator [Pseudomonadota bacterium]
MDHQPLYEKVRLTLVDRMISGAWLPGQMVPSEFKIADDLGVSQGTVRKALDEMASAGLLVRKQGRGTFVAEAEDRAILFKFYRLTADNALSGHGTTQDFPQSEFLSVQNEKARSKFRSVFGIAEHDTIWRLERLRRHNGKVILWEEIALPAKRFEGFDRTSPLPNNLYRFYSKTFGVTVSKVEERLKAISATRAVAAHLEITEASPLLEITRQAQALDGPVIEWRRSLCSTNEVHYYNAL